MEDNLDPKTRYFKAASLVDQYCINRELPTDKYFNKFLSRLLFGITQLKMDMANDVITVLLRISDVNTVTLPENYVNWVKIGVPYGQYVKTLCVNDDLSLQDRTLGNPEFSKKAGPGWLPNGVNVADYGGYYFSNYGGSSLFSVGGGLPNTGHFKVVQRPGNNYELLLDVGIPSENIYIEYIGLGINPSGETVLSPLLGDWAISYLDHQYEKYMQPSQRSEAAIMRTGRDLWHREQVVRGRTNALSPKDILMITRKYYRLTNKA